MKRPFRGVAQLIEPGPLAASRVGWSGSNSGPPLTAGQMPFWKLQTFRVMAERETTKAACRFVLTFTSPPGCFFPPSLSYCVCCRGGQPGYEHYSRRPALATHTHTPTPHHCVYLSQGHRLPGASRANKVRSRKTMTNGSRRPLSLRYIEFLLRGLDNTSRSTVGNSSAQQLQIWPLATSHRQYPSSLPRFCCWSTLT